MCPTDWLHVFRIGISDRRIDMAKHIVVVGSLNMDLVVRAAHLPQAGETILGSDFRTFPGGKGANQAVAAARLGGTVKMIGRVGADDFGNALLQNAAADGVDTTYLLQDSEASTGVALITVDSAGQNTIVVASGANGRLTAEDVTNAEEAFRGAAVLLLQLESPLTAVGRAIELAKQHGAKVILNPAPAQGLEAALLSGVDYLIPNQTELALLTGIEHIPDALSALHRWGVRCVIVTLGGEGALLVENGVQIHLPAYRVPVVDTTAAGDAFVGAFAVALTEGLTPRQAVEWGNAAGALAVTRAGAQPSLPTRQEFDRLIKAVNISAASNCC
jgi:ribokinase